MTLAWKTPLSGSCEPFSGVRVICGRCGKAAEFAKFGGGGDSIARKAGWHVEQRPRPIVRCPKCNEAYMRLDIVDW